MRIRRLTKEEFKATFGERMINITGQEDKVSPNGVVDVIPYVEAIPAEDMDSHQIGDYVAESVFRTNNARYDHVLFKTETKNVYLVIVINLEKNEIEGHLILDFNREYSAPTPEQEG